MPRNSMRGRLIHIRHSCAQCSTYRPTGFNDLKLCFSCGELLTFERRLNNELSLYCFVDWEKEFRMPILRVLFSRGRSTDLFFAILMSVGLCLLTSCGNSDIPSPVGTTGSSKAAPVATPTSAGMVSDLGSAQGCPNGTVAGSMPKATITVAMPGGQEPTVFAHIGDVIEFRFPFGKRWGGPFTSQGNLTLQQPPGYTVVADKVCVWRFTAERSGTTELHFTSRPLCKPGEMCALYILDVPVIVVVT